MNEVVALDDPPDESNDDDRRHRRAASGGDRSRGAILSKGKQGGAK